LLSYDALKSDTGRRDRARCEAIDRPFAAHIRFLITPHGPAIERQRRSTADDDPPPTGTARVAHRRQRAVDRWRLQASMKLRKSGWGWIGFDLNSGMELAGQEVGMIRDLDDLDEAVVRRLARDAQAALSRSSMYLRCTS
jgi:hypothetical protein